MVESSQKGRKHCVFNRLRLQTRKNQDLFGKGLNMFEIFFTATNMGLGFFYCYAISDLVHKV